MSAAYAKILAGLDVSSPFVGPRELERRRGRPYKARLGSNECLFGVSPAALDVLAARGRDTALYSDPTHTELRDAIAATWRVSRRHLVIAEGIEGLLGLFVRAMIDPGDVAVTSLGGYPSFDYYVRGCAGRLVHQRQLAALGNDLDGLAAAAVAHRAKLVYLANPDNPTGLHVAPPEIRRLADQLPDGCLLLLDEAYAEFADPAAVMPCDEVRPNLIRLRTFSKIYGLAGARVGYAIGDPDVLAPLETIRQHWAVSKLAQEMALAAFHDHAFVDEIRAHTVRGRAAYAELAEQIGAAAVASSANFVAFDFGDSATARAATEWLDRHDVFVRRVPDPPVDRLVRITVCPPETRAYLGEVLHSFRADARAGNRP